MNSFSIFRVSHRLATDRPTLPDDIVNTPDIRLLRFYAARKLRHHAFPFYAKLFGLPLLSATDGPKTPRTDSSAAFAPPAVDATTNSFSLGSLNDTPFGRQRAKRRLSSAINLLMSPMLIFVTGSSSSPLRLCPVTRNHCAFVICVEPIQNTVPTAGRHSIISNETPSPRSKTREGKRFSFHINLLDKRENAATPIEAESAGDIRVMNPRKRTPLGKEA